MNISDFIKGEFVTSRLKLTHLDSSDANFIHALTNSKGWLKFIGDRQIHNLHDAVKYIDKIASNSDSTYWKVCLKTDHEAIGVITLIKRDYLDYYDLGFAFLPQFSNHGYAFEASEKVLDQLFNITDQNKVCAITIPENKKSIRLLNKLGLRLEKHIVRENENLMLYAISNDQHDINILTKSFFQIFNNKNHSKPDFDLVCRICIPEAVIIKKDGLNQEVYNLKSFIEPRAIILTDGTLNNFEEYEIEQHTNIIGNIAQRRSKFYKEGLHNGVEFQQTGNKLFQFIRSHEGWKISSVVWEDSKD